MQGQLLASTLLQCREPIKDSNRFNSQVQYETLCPSGYDSSRPMGQNNIHKKIQKGYTIEWGVKERRCCVVADLVVKMILP